MNNLIDIAIFDVDGTIWEKGVVPDTVVRGFKHLHKNSTLTTISTGRGYIRLREALGVSFDDLISDKSPIIVEHGTKIVDKKGNTLFADFLNDEEIDHIVDFTRNNIDLFKMLLFYPNNPNEKVKICCFNESDLEMEIKKRGHYAEVFYASLGELNSLIRLEKLTNITLKLKPYIKVENLKLLFTRTETKIVFQDGEMVFLKQNTNKALAIKYLLDYLKISSNKLLVAGNAINDVEMLDFDSKETLLVGPKESREMIKSYLSDLSGIIELENPSKLGEYLLSL